MEGISAAVSKGALSAVSDLTKEVVSRLRKAGRNELSKLSIIFETAFQKFLLRNLKQHSRIKTLLNPHYPISLEAVFEAPHLKIGEIDLDENGFIDTLEDAGFAVVTGRGGAGKSVFLKHIFIRYYNEGRGRVPFLIELRNVPKDVQIIKYMHSLITDTSPEFDTEMFEFALRSGKFLFLFDGFDEVDYNRRRDISDQITRLSYTYDDNLFLVASRPDDIFNGWSEFIIADMVAFTKPQVISLIRKTKYDQKTKTGFIKLVKEGSLYDTHTSYLSNPLLCIIMLLTFDHRAEIPYKLHLFLSHTFDVLFFRHDATKGTFRRKFHTSLSIDDFRYALSAFSAFSYSDYGPTMSRRAALTASEKAIDYCGFKEDANSFLIDLDSSISLLLQEGGVYSFIHRTFQEYFCAAFVAQQNLNDWAGVVQHLIESRPNDTVVDLLADIARDRFDFEFLAPRVSELGELLKRIDIDLHPASAFRLFFQDIGVRRTGANIGISTWITETRNERAPWFYMVRFLIGPQAEEMAEFDWRSHLVTFGTRETDTAEIILGEITDEKFVNTPMVGFLNGIKTAAKEKHLELQSEKAIAKAPLVRRAVWRRSR